MTYGISIMAMNEDVSYVEDLLQCAEQKSDNFNNIQNDYSNCHAHLKTSRNENLERSSAVWTYNKTLVLLRLYENKLEMLKTPKKKTRIWVAISESLRDYNIMMSSDQVRWKINALTKKYKQCLDKRRLIKFRYFRELDKIYAQYNVEYDTSYNLNNIIKNKRKTNERNSKYLKSNGESKAMIELRKVRLANRIESDRLQSKIILEKQWLEYLEREEHNKLIQDEVYEKSLIIREEKFEFSQQKLLMKESQALRQLELKERQENEMLTMEREKLELLYSIIANRNEA